MKNASFKKYVICMPNKNVGHKEPLILWRYKSNTTNILTSYPKERYYSIVAHSQLAEAIYPCPMVRKKTAYFCLFIINLNYLFSSILRRVFSEQQLHFCYSLGKVELTVWTHFQWVACFVSLKWEEKKCCLKRHFGIKEPMEYTKYFPEIMLFYF